MVPASTEGGAGVTQDESGGADIQKGITEEFDSDPAWQRGIGEMVQAQKVSHQAQGDTYLRDGKLREAIEEYRKDLGLEITTYALAATVQQAHCHMGDAFLMLGDFEEAALAYEAALEVWQAYGYGEMPLASLAVAYLELGRVADALRVCEEHPEEAGDPCLQRVLAESRRLQAGGEPAPGSVPGCRRIHQPWRLDAECPPATGHS